MDAFLAAKAPFSSSSASSASAAPLPPSAAQLCSSAPWRQQNQQPQWSAADEEEYQHQRVDEAVSVPTRQRIMKATLAFQSAILAQPELLLPQPKMRPEPQDTEETKRAVHTSAAPKTMAAPAPETSAWRPWKKEIQRAESQAMEEEIQRVEAMLTEVRAPKIQRVEEDAEVQQVRAHGPEGHWCDGNYTFACDNPARGNPAYDNRRWYYLPPLSECPWAVEEGDGER